MFCVYCGKSIDDDSRFCVYCGRKFDNVFEVNGPVATMVRPVSSVPINQSQQNTSTSLFQASVCPCCGAPIRSNVMQCEYCDTPFVRNTPQTVQPTTVRVVAQPVQVVAQPVTQAVPQAVQYNNAYANQLNQQMLMQNNQAQKLANAQITAAAIHGGAEITSAAIRGGAKIASSIFRGLF